MQYKTGTGASGQYKLELAEMVKTHTSVVQRAEREAESLSEPPVAEPAAHVATDADVASARLLEAVDTLVKPMYLIVGKVTQLTQRITLAIVLLTLGASVSVYTLWRTDQLVVQLMAQGSAQTAALRTQEKLVERMEKLAKAAEDTRRHVNALEKKSPQVEIVAEDDPKKAHNAPIKLRLRPPAATSAQLAPSIEVELFAKKVRPVPSAN